MHTTAVPASTISTTLRTLGVKDINSGVSTGTVQFAGEGELLESFSPVDGQLIGAVKGASRTEYDSLITTAQMAFAGRLVAFNAVELGPITELKPVVEGWEGQRGYMPMQGNGSLEVSFSPFIKQ